MIGREIEVRNGEDLLTIWKVCNNKKEEEVPSMDIYMHDAGLNGFNFKTIVISKPCRSQSYNNAQNSSEDDNEARYHSMISPLDINKVHNLAKKRKKDTSDKK